MFAIFGIGDNVAEVFDIDGDPIGGDDFDSRLVQCMFANVNLSFMTNCRIRRVGAYV